jgi:integrase-like protein
VSRTPLDAVLPQWKTGSVATPEQSLEALVKDELRGPVSELGRRLVPELVAEALNGAAAGAEMPLSGSLVPPATTKASDATPDPPPTKRCNGCNRDLRASAFSPKHYRCRECRRREWREGEQRRWAEAEEPAAGQTSGERMHKARHTAGQRVLDQTRGNLKAVQTLLGHASISTTGDIYTDWDISQLEETLRGMLEEGDS